MSVKTSAIRSYARWVTDRIATASLDPIAAQQMVLAELLEAGSKTAFGKDHSLAQVSDHQGLVEAVPLRDYEALSPYMERAKNGEESVLWPGKPLYLCKTSGTTSGAKYIPLTKEILDQQIASARNALLAYIARSGNASFVDGKLIFLQGSPELDESGKVPVGRLSGIVARHVPKYLQRQRLPSFETNTIEDWSTKVDAIIGETKDQDMRLISGIPAWVQQYFERLLEQTGKANIKQLFPNFSLFVHGGVNYEPYRNHMEKLIGGSVDNVETFPASEGFFAYQDRYDEEGLLLVTNGGIYYGFLPLENSKLQTPNSNSSKSLSTNNCPLSIAEVEIGVNYAMILYTKAGLWGYELGDTIKFLSLSPPRIVVTGRTKHFTSAFGEHVIAEEVEGSMKEAVAAHPCEVIEFTVAPETTPSNDGLPYHEWFVEFAKEPAEREVFSAALDGALQKRNPYYRDLIEGKVLRPLMVRYLPQGSFANWMESRGMLGGQNKVPRLANDRRYVEGLSGST